MQDARNKTQEQITTRSCRYNENERLRCVRDAMRGAGDGDLYLVRFRLNFFDMLV